jgi:leucyl/phenylalanyl-tRNA--protein transferase
MPIRTRRGAQAPFPYLTQDIDFPFPDPGAADLQGVLCSGGNLSPGMLISAYRRGIFPWFSEGDPILWWSPDPRFVLFPEELHASRSLLRRLRSAERGAGGFELSLDRDFPAVIRACSSVPRPGQGGTWITEAMIEAYVELHRLGLAHSAEARLEGRLVGGLYGVSLGSAFFGESMFSLEDDASKAAFVPLVWRLRDEGFLLVDSQVRTGHLASLGGREIPRGEYLERLAAALIDGPSAAARRGPWSAAFPDFPRSRAWDSLVAGA